MSDSNLVWFFMLGIVLAYVIRRVFNVLDDVARQNAQNEIEARRRRKLDELYGRTNEKDR